MNKARRGFTLIELLLVISIIILLMALLVPSIQSVMLAVKNRNSQSRVDLLAQAVDEYHRTYNAYPLDDSPNLSMNKDANDAYPPYIYPSGDEAAYIFKYEANHCQPFGGKFLAYFLMGPNGNGWHRPRSAGTSAPNARNKGIRAEWDPPSGLTEFFENKPLEGGDPITPFPCFVDAFGIEGQNGGLIGYMAARPGQGGFEKWNHNVPGWTRYFPFEEAYYYDTRSHPSYPGDGKVQEHIAKMLKECPGDFVVLSPGADHKFGYRVYGQYHDGKYKKGSWANIELGLTDDLANFPLR